MSLKNATIINAIGKYSVVVIQLFVTAILSRILSAEDYGVIAVITVFSTFFSTLSNMGFGTAIIQNKSLTNKDIDNIYSFTFYIAVILSIIFSLFSFVIAYFYRDNIYIAITMLLSISLFFGTLNMIPNGILNREKKFISIALRTVIIYVFGAVIAILLATLGMKYYALVFQTIVTSFLTFLWNYISTKPKFKFKIDFKSIKKIANYSGFQFAFNFVNYFAGNMDNLLTGKFFGTAELGYYNKAYNLTLYPVNNLTGVISPVLHPILSDFQNDKKIIYQKYIKVLKLLSVLGIYIEAVCFLCSKEIINIMFGNQWNQSAICFKLLSICIVFRMINSSSGAIFQSLGNTKLLFKNGLLNSCITVMFILIGIFFFGNIEGLALCVALSYVIHYITTSIMLVKSGFKFSLKEYYIDLKKEIILLFIMMILAFIYSFNFENIYLSLIYKFVYLSIAYIILLYVTKEYKVVFLLKNKS